MKRTIACLLAMVLCLSLLAGCGKAEETSSDPSAIWSETRYTAQHTPLGVYQLEQGAAIHGDTIYFCAYLSVQNSSSQLCAIDKSGGDIRPLDAYKPQSRTADEAGLVPTYRKLQICAAENHLWVLAERDYIVPAGRQPKPASLRLQQVDPSDGRIIHEVVVSENEYDSSQLSLCCDSQGNAYVTFGKGIFVYDTDGQALGQLSGFGGRLLTLSNGSAAYLSNSQDGTQWRLRQIDPKTCGFLEEIPVNAIDQNSFTQLSTKLYPGGDEYLFLYDDGQSLYGYRMGEDGEPCAGEHLLTWINCDLIGISVVAVGETEDGFACITDDETFGCEMVQLRRRPPLTRSR